MRVFISWSKETSLHFARVLRSWLPDVIQQVRPWVSEDDIEKGRRWAVELEEKLDEAAEGLICVTAENQREPWLNFEAGALARSLGDAAVRPVLLGVAPTEVTGPLAQFQATRATDRDDMLKLVTSLNNRCGDPLDRRRLEVSFDRVWDGYAAKVRRIEELASAAPAARQGRTAEDMTREILELTRDLNRRSVLEELGRTARSRRRRVDAAPDVMVDGVAFGRSVSHRRYGGGTICELLPDMPALDGSATVLVDFKKHGPAVVRLEDLVLQGRFSFVDQTGQGLSGRS